MILIDANLLLYAYNAKAERHERSRAWLEAVLSGPDLVRFAWLTLWAFLRIATSPRVFDRPLSAAEARAAISSWLEQPVADIVEPGERHWEILGGLLDDGQTVGPLVMDAVLAAIALEHGARLCTTDRDFSRFDGLEWTNPLAAEA
jgi:toxin-antitoxin system PIN domain toxin